MKYLVYKGALLVLVFMFTAQLATAQKKKKEKSNEKPKREASVTKEEIVAPVEETMVVEEVVMEAPVSYDRGSSAMPKLVGNIRFNNQYEIYGGITSGYDWFFNRFAPGDRKYGIVNKSGDVILPDLFVRDYTSENTVILKLEDRSGVYDLASQRWSIPLEYESLTRLSNSNLFIAKKNRRYGVLDVNNIEIVPFEWDYIEAISGLDNYVIVRSNAATERQFGIYSLIEKRLTVPCQYASLTKMDKKFAFRVQNGVKYNIVDIQNTPQFKQWYDDLMVTYNDADRYIVKLNGKFGVIDDNEKALVPIEYQEIDKSQFSDGSHLAKNKLGKYGCIRLDGQVTLPFEYDNLKREYNTYGSVVSVQNGKCGLVQISSGSIREIVTCDFDNIKGISNVFVVERNKLFGLLNETGKPITEIEYQSLEMLNSRYGGNGLIRAKKDGLYRLINLLGKPLSNSKFEDLSVIPNKISYYDESPQFTYMKGKEKGGKYSLIDQVGLSVTKPMFDDVVWESQNLATVKLNGKYGIYYILNQSLVVDYGYDQIVNAKGYYIGIKGNSIDVFKIESGKMVIIDSKK